MVGQLTSRTSGMGSFKTEISAAVAHDKGLLKTKGLNALNT